MIGKVHQREHSDRDAGGSVEDGGTSAARKRSTDTLTCGLFIALPKPASWTERLCAGQVDAVERWPADWLLKSERWRLSRGRWQEEVRGGRSTVDVGGGGGAGLSNRDRAQQPAFSHSARSTHGSGGGHAKQGKGHVIDNDEGQ
jgi:hypothetical protein